MDDNPYASPREQCSSPMSQDLFDARFMFCCGCFLAGEFVVGVYLAFLWPVTYTVVPAILTLIASLVVFHGSGAALARHEQTHGSDLNGQAPI